MLTVGTYEEYSYYGYMAQARMSFGDITPILIDTYEIDMFVAHVFITGAFEVTFSVIDYGNLANYCKLTIPDDNVLIILQRSSTSTESTSHFYRRSNPNGSTLEWPTDTFGRLSVKQFCEYIVPKLGETIIFNVEFLETIS